MFTIALNSIYSDCIQCDHGKLWQGLCTCLLARGQFNTNEYQPNLYFHLGTMQVPNGCLLISARFGQSGNHFVAPCNVTFAELQWLGCVHLGAPALRALLSEVNPVKFVAARRGMLHVVLCTSQRAHRDSGHRHATLASADTKTGLY